MKTPDVAFMSPMAATAGLRPHPLASISPPDTGLYRRNASGRQSGIRQMLCLFECSIVCGSPGNLPLMKILVVDDHALIREALHGVLRKLTREAVI